MSVYRSTRRSISPRSQPISSCWRRAAYAPPPEGSISPMTWGIKANVIERFVSAGISRDRISFLRETYNFNFPGPPKTSKQERKARHERPSLHHKRLAAIHRHGALV